MSGHDREIIEHLRRQHCICEVLRYVAKADARAAVKNRASTKLPAKCVTCRIIDESFVPWRGTVDLAG